MSHYVPAPYRRLHGILSLYGRGVAACGSNLSHGRLHPGMALICPPITLHGSNLSFGPLPSCFLGWFHEVRGFCQ